MIYCILSISAFDFIFMLFSGMVKPVFFMDEFFAAATALYNSFFVDMSCMAN